MGAGSGLRRVLEWFRRVLDRPGDELTRWQRAARFASQLVREGAARLRRDDAPLMAGALAFRTLFGLVPVLVVASLLARAVYGPERLQQAIGGLADWVFGGQGGGGDGSLSAWVKSLASEAQHLNLAALGSLGFVLLAYSAVSLMVTIENAFNRVCGASSGRSWLRRLPVYWTVLSLAPVVMGSVLYVNTQVQSVIDAIEAGVWVLQLARMLWSFLIVWMLLLAMYRLLPATEVRLRPALAGSFAAALCLGFGQQFLGAYLGGVQSIRLLGSVGLIPLFMFWVYAMWLAVLFGLELAATLQHLDRAGVAGAERGDLAGEDR